MIVGAEMYVITFVSHNDNTKAYSDLCIATTVYIIFLVSYLQSYNLIGAKHFAKFLDDDHLFDPVCCLSNSNILTKSNLKVQFSCHIGIKGQIIVHFLLLDDPLRVSLEITSC